MECFLLRKWHVGAAGTAGRSWAPASAPALAGRFRVGSFASQDFYTFGCEHSVDVLRRFAERVIFPCKTTNESCGDLRRGRIRARSAQTNVGILALRRRSRGASDRRLPDGAGTDRVFTEGPQIPYIYIYIYIYICIYLYILIYTHMLLYVVVKLSAHTLPRFATCRRTLPCIFP